MPQIAKRKKVVKRNRNSYSVEQKKNVITYAKQHGKYKAAKYFNLNASMIGRWLKASESWITDETNQSSKRVGAGRKAFYPEAEVKLYAWLTEQRKQGLAVTYRILRLKMLDILRESDMIVLYGNVAEKFKTSNRWLSAFMKRYKLSWRRRTRISQKLPAQTEELLNKFRQFIIQLRTEKCFELCNIFNMDETPVWFDMAGNFTIDQKGKKTIQIRSTGNEKNRFTVVLTCAAGRIHFFKFLDH